MRQYSFGTLCVVIIALTSVAACRDDSTPPSLSAPISPALDRQGSATVQLVRQLAAGRGIVPLPPKLHIRDQLVKLGEALAFDPVLSGNKNISCMTCHMPALATGDDQSLSIGEGGTGFGPARQHPNGTFIPRNAPPLFNMLAIRHLFWDGRIQMDANGKVQTPAGDQVTPAMARVFEFGPISAIAMFPVTNRAEMRGQSENELGRIVDSDNPAIWRALMARLGAIPEYVKLFEKAYPDARFADMTFAHAANAIGAFIVDKFSFGDSPWDRFLGGKDHALSDAQLAGAQTFLTLKCSICHSGPAFTDEQFHNVAVPQLGPGVGDGANGLDDFGRMRVTGAASDLYRFRTTPLRNVELTAPYGHDGAIMTLRDFVAHYSESDLKLQAFDPSQLDPRLRGTVRHTTSDILATRDTLLNGVVLTPEIVDRLMSYMSALTDDAARHMDNIVPQHVPSGLPVIPRRP